MPVSLGTFTGQIELIDSRRETASETGTKATRYEQKRLGGHTSFITLLRLEESSLEEQLDIFNQ
jgi:hypothetical protein